MKTRALLIVALLLFWILLVFSCRKARGGDVRWLFQLANTNAVAVRSLKLYPVGGPFTNAAGAIITRDFLQGATDTNGTITLSNIYGWTYRGEITGPNAVTTNWYNFPLTNGLIYAADWTTNVMPTIGQPDFLYWRKNVLGPGNNISFRTNGGGQVFIDGSAGGGGGAATNLAAGSNAVLWVAGGTNFIAATTDTNTVLALAQRASTVLSNTVANVFTTNAVGSHGVQAADIGTAAYVSTNFSVQLMSPQGGNVAFDDMAAATSDHVGQLGLSWPGSKTPGLWFAASVGTGSNAWNRAPWNFFSGFGQIGHFYAMPSSLSNVTASGIRFIQNGNASDQSYYAVTNSNSRNGSGFYHYNMNPYSDGNFLSLPMVTTNAALATGGAVSTNADGAKIYIRDPFGFTIDSIPSEYIQGETNQAGSLAFIAGISHDLPFYISANMNGIPGETVSGYSQHDWVCFDQRYLLDNTKPLGVHFPMQVPYAWHVTNALRKNALDVDEIPGHGHISVWSNIYLGGSIMATQQTAMKASIFGPNWADSGNGLALLVTTNAHFGGNNDIMTTFDFQNFHRLGIGKIGVNFPKHYHASGTPWTISRSSAADLQTLPISGQTITDELVIDSSGNLAALGSSNYFSGDINIAGTRLLSVNHTNSGNLQTATLNTTGNAVVGGTTYLAGATTHSNNVTVAAAFTITATNVGASKLAGTDAAGQFTNIVVGSGLSLSAGQLTATAASASVISNSASQMADSNVKVATIADGDVLTYVLSDHRWTNKPSVGGGDVTKSGNNPFTGSNNFAGLTLFSNNAAMDAAHQFYFSNLTASRAVFTDAGKGLVSATASGAVPMDADGTATTKAQVITLVGDIVTNGYTPAITLPEAAAPSSPAANNQSIYADSTSHNLAAKNSSGTVNHMVQSKAFATHQWLTAIADDGTVSQSQPAFSDITGSVAASQLPVTVVTNNAALSNNRVQLGDGGRGLKDAAASGAVPIDADGSATTAAQVNALFPSPVITNNSTLASMALTNLPFVTSVSIPPGAWFTNNVADGAALTAASSQNLTNTGDNFVFADAVTNTINGRFDLPWDWDAGVVRVGIRAFCSGTNASVPAAAPTNVVWSVRAAAIGDADRENVLTWGTAVLVTNGIPTNSYSSSAAITGDLTVGNTPTTAKSILWQISRNGGMTGDTLTNSSLAISGVRIYYRTLSRTNFPTASP